MNKDGSLLVLPDNLAGEGIELARQGLVEALAQSGKVVLDCSMLTELDEHGMVFLCSSHRHALSRGKELIFQGLSESLARAARSQVGGFLPNINCPHSLVDSCLWS